jgi:hypothetical protein
MSWQEPLSEATSKRRIAALCCSAPGRELARVHRGATINVRDGARLVVGANTALALAAIPYLVERYGPHGTVSLAASRVVVGVTKLEGVEIVGAPARLDVPRARAPERRASRSPEAARRPCQSPEGEPQHRRRRPGSRAAARSNPARAGAPAMGSRPMWERRGVMDTRAPSAVLRARSIGIIAHFHCAFRRVWLHRVQSIAPVLPDVTRGSGAVID